MKRIALLLIFAAFVTGSAAAQAKGSTQYISAKTAALKSSTGFFAGTTGTLNYGDQVTVLQVKGKWAEVKATARNVSGWIASSNLTSKRVSAGAASGASNSEVALAGKGFNQEVENAYKADGKLNYDDVDKTEAQQVSNDDLYKFLTDGHLATGE
jgi:uncharacterized protein YgiM (DUF1202 family)